MKTVLLVTAILSASVFSQEYYDRGTLVKLTPTTVPISSKMRSATSGASVRWFNDQNGVVVGITNTIIVQWKTPSQAVSVLKSMNISTSEWLTKKMMIVTVPANSDLFVLCRKLSENSAIEFAQPNFIQDRSRR